MVSFAWKTFSDWQSSRSMNRKTQTEKNKTDEEYMEAFKKTFCRDEVHVHFLGLFDCVNSVGQFDLPFTSTSFQQIPTKVAENVRHAVAINERRIKFKPALFHQDGHQLDSKQVKEVWFAGAHGDIGGGWPLEEGQTRTLSTLPLKWMLDEIRDLPDDDGKIQFEPHQKSFLEREVDPSGDNLNNFVLEPEAKAAPKFPKPHDELIFGRAKSGFMSMLATAFWRLIGTYQSALHAPCVDPANMMSQSTSRSSRVLSTRKQRRNGLSNVFPRRAELIATFPRTLRFILPSSFCSKKACCPDTRHRRRLLQNAML